jgi:hypothetical protein
MIFKPESLRTFDAKTPSPSIEIRTKGGSPLILIKSTGEVAYARTITDKDALIARFDDEKDLLLWIWRGQHPAHTDVFRISRADLDKFYSRKLRRQEQQVQAAKSGT